MDTHHDVWKQAALAAMKALENASGNINPERSYCDELEAEIMAALAALRLASEATQQGPKVQVDVVCPSCDGSGLDAEDNNYSCSTCEGAGRVSKEFYTRPQLVIPLGYKIVPVEPTAEMLTAACQDGADLNGRPVWKHPVDVQAKWKWQQMLEAVSQAGIPR